MDLRWEILTPYAPLFVTGAWMTNRRPRRLPDRYVHYFANTSKYGFSINKRNANGLVTIA